MSDQHAKPKRALCAACLRAERTCICTLASPIAHATEVLILQHPLEVHQAKGSARLLHLCLPRSRIIVGERFDTATLRSQLYEPWPQAPDKIEYGPLVQPVLLYPQTATLPSDALDLAAQQNMFGRWRLVILDGTWRKSRKILHLNPLLAMLPRLSLADFAPSRYQIRKAHHPQQLSTLEAACHALSRLEGDPERFQPLLHVFEEFVARQMRYAQAAGSTTETGSTEA